MSIQTVRNGQSISVTLSGELTIYTVTELKDALAKDLADAIDVEIDLFGVSEVDTAGLQLLLLVKRMPHKKVGFINHSPPVIRLVDLANLGSVFGDPLLISAIDS